MLDETVPAKNMPRCMREWSEMKSLGDESTITASSLVHVSATRVISAHITTFFPASDFSRSGRVFTTSGLNEELLNSG